MTKNDFELIESRAHKRYEFMATATVHLKKNSSLKLSALVGDISRAGLGLQTYDPLEIGTDVIMELRFMTNRGEKEKENLEGRVARIDQQNNTHFMGIIFDSELDQNNNPRLYQYYSKGPAK